MERDRTFPPTELHISELAYMSLSPAHLRAAYEEPRDPSPQMFVGTLAHALILGGERIAVYDGKVRNGKAWDAFEAENAGKLLATARDYEKAQRIAKAVLEHPVAAPLLIGEKETSLTWDAFGLKCGGRLDVLGATWIADVKTTSRAEPNMFTRHALRMAYHAKAAWYMEGARRLKLPVDRFYLIAVETAAPFAVQCFCLTPRALEQGAKIVCLWVEYFKACLASKSWPAYSQTILDLDVPEDVELAFGEEAKELPF